MNLAKYLHERWAAADDLNGLLPEEKVFTGMSSDPAPPYAVISQEGRKPFTRHSDGSALDKVLVRIQVFHGQYDAGPGIIREINRAFEGSSFDLDDGCKVFNMLRTDQREKQLEPGVWQFILDFQCTVFLPEGA